MHDELRRHMELLEAKPSTALIGAVQKFVLFPFTYYDAENQKSIQTVFDAEMPVIGKSMDLYRGIAFRYWPRIDPDTDFRNRDVLKFSRCVSTSEVEGAAREFIIRNMNSRDGGGVGILFKIRTHPDAKGIVMDEFRKYVDKSYDSEHEVILDRNTEYKVIKAERGDWPGLELRDVEYWEVQLEQIK